MELIESNVISIPEVRKFDFTKLIHSFGHVISLDEMLQQAYIFRQSLCLG